MRDQLAQNAPSSRRSSTGARSCAHWLDAGNAPATSRCRNGLYAPRIRFPLQDRLPRPDYTTLVQVHDLHTRYVVFENMSIIVSLGILLSGAAHPHTCASYLGFPIRATAPQPALLPRSPRP